VKILANEIRSNHILDINKDLYKVVKTEHVKPGKGGAFIQAELKNIKTGQKKPIKFRSDEKVDYINVYEKTGVFAYKEKDDFVFLDQENYEEVRCNHIVNEEFLEDQMEVSLLIDNNGNLIDINLPDKITCQVSMTDGFINGQSAASQLKNATLTNGIHIKVPQYIQNGDKIIINSKDLSFSSRA